MLFIHSDSKPYSIVPNQSDLIDRSILDSALEKLAIPHKNHLRLTRHDA